EIARGQAPDGPCFAPPTLHALPRGAHTVAGYTDTELFGPDLCVESFSALDEAIAVINAPPFGFANSVFSAGRDSFEAVYRGTRAGIMNWNRSTNQASPRLPFGGVGRNGNYRPAGSHAGRNLAIPTAVQENLPGALTPHPMLEVLLPAP